MPQTPLTFALFGSVYQSADSDFLHQLFSCLHEKGAHLASTIMRLRRSKT